MTKFSEGRAELLAQVDGDLLRSSGLTPGQLAHVQSVRNRRAGKGPVDLSAGGADAIPEEFALLDSDLRALPLALGKHVQAARRREAARLAAGGKPSAASRAMGLTAPEPTTKAATKPTKPTPTTAALSAPAPTKLTPTTPTPTKPPKAPPVAALIRGRSGPFQLTADDYRMLPPGACIATGGAVTF